MYVYIYIYIYIMLYHITVNYITGGGGGGTRAAETPSEQTRYGVRMRGSTALKASEPTATDGA